MDAVWIVAALVISFVVTWLSGYYFIPFLHKLKFGQPINDIGPTWHATKKGTPTMGGIMMVCGLVPAVGVVMAVTGGASSQPEVTGIDGRLLIGVIMSLFYGLCGFIDDFAKVKKGRNTGLSRIQKLVLQILIAAAYLASLQMLGRLSTQFWIPFVGYIDLGIAYYPLMVFVIVATVNAVNIHDGIDGLCSSTMSVASLAFFAIASLNGLFGSQVLCMATLGACLGFLVWNHNPAKIFMGDLGSHLLGGLLVAMAFAVDKPILLAVVGVIYVIETGSDIIQGISYKTTGKRVFKMSPIHHHFEMCGWSENKIVAVFSAVALLGGIGGWLLAYYGGVIK